MTKQVIICVDDEKTILKSLKTELKEALGNTYRIEIAEEIGRASCRERV